MTRYEIEEMADYIIRLEDALDDWAVDKKDMELVLADLQIMIKWIQKAMAKPHSDNGLVEVLPDLKSKAIDCSECIKTRLYTRKK